MVYQALLKMTWPFGLGCAFGLHRIGTTSNRKEKNPNGFYTAKDDCLVLKVQELSGVHYQQAKMQEIFTVP